MNAGINPTEEALAKFNEFKMKKKLAAIVFKIDKVDNVEHVVCDKEFPKEGFEQDKLIINAKSKKKMLYSTTFGSLNSQLGGGISTEMQCDSPAELSREHILKKVKK